MAIDKPNAESCARNQAPILAVLRDVFAMRRRVLEIGSGTGQHAVHFAAAMPWLTWQASDQAMHLPGITAWLDDARLSNTPAAIALDVAGDWSHVLADATAQADAGATAVATRTFDAAFTANTLHIMGWPQVGALFAGLDGVLADDATFVAYGPFNVEGRFSSDSNRQFDAWLKARDAASGIRDSAAVDALARGIGLRLVDDIAMPANNRCVVWRR